MKRQDRVDEDDAEPSHKVIDIVGPIILRDAQGQVIEGLVIDEAQWQSAQWTIRGWCIGEPTFFLRHNGLALRHAVSRHKRPDVAKNLSLTDTDDGFGFTLTAPANSPNTTFEWRPQLLNQGRESTTYKRQLNQAVGAQVNASAGLTVNVPARAHIEAAGYIASAKCVVLLGWVLGDVPSNLLVQGDDGHAAKVAGAHPIYRSDVFNVFGREHAAHNPMPGFLAFAHLEKLTSKIRLLQPGVEDQKKKARTLCEVDVKPVTGDVKDIFNWLNGFQTAPSEWARRYEQLDVPIMETVIKNDRDAWSFLPVHTHAYGETPTKPVVSVIVPLYGRTDFVEHQLIEFAKDAWLREHAELIFVLDDPALVHHFAIQSRQLHQLYKLPFIWLWGTINRGFAGANNLGVSVAKGKHLLFLNSDAFPAGPGWLEALVNTLESSADIGAVGPKLLHFDGSIQHAGMAFQYRPDLGFHINHHPGMGLAADLDSSKQPTQVPAVTGACLLMRRKHFDQVGGWDTGYLIGDFEDSDLCLKLRDAGLHVVYDPSVTLIHLERQSLKQIGSDDFRSKVVTYNAVRHQMRWADALSELVHQGA